MEFSESGMEFLVREDTAVETGTSDEVVRCERFLPDMAVRVLLVEGDDSTRHIIAALLRKCSYRVAAVADGLKAWEVLRARSSSIDLILIEVDLPLISGYALLTLIMEHEACKNIPVIMMSSHDSVSTVYGCVLRGAADFLVKPVRKNELQNLWQHVWRKQASVNAAGQKKDEATAQNNAATDNHSSDAQSSWAKPGSANDGDEQIRSSSQPMISSQHASDISQNDDLSGNSSKQAIDLIGAFDNHFNAALIGCSSSNFDAAPQLDLSLRRSSHSHPSGSVSQANEKGPRLNHSEASAFSRYISKPEQQKDHEIIFERRASDHCPEYQFDRLNPAATMFFPQTDSQNPAVDGGSCYFRNNNHVSSAICDPSERDAALTKFRLKRKERCFQKKVQYESRKKLAEQRPRVKGQFVRLVGNATLA